MNKRKRDPADQQLYKLEPIPVENFVRKLLNESRRNMAAIATSFDGRLPTYMYCISDKQAAKATIAFKVGTRTVDGVLNTHPVYVSQIISETIASKVEKYVNDGMDLRKAKKKAEKKLFSQDKQTAADISNFYRQAEKLIAYAEGNMASTILNILNADQAYIAAKAIRCPISYIEAIRKRAAQSSDNAQLNRERLLTQIKSLTMEGRASYVSYKETFLSLVHSLRVCDSLIEETQLINTYLARLDQTIFMNIYFHRIDRSGWYHPAQDLERLDEAVKLTDKLFNTYIDADKETKRAKNTDNGNNNGNSNSNSNGNSNGNNNSNAKDKSNNNNNDSDSDSNGNSNNNSNLRNLDEAIQDEKEINIMKSTTKPCRNFQKKGKCSYGDKCKFSHN